MQSNEDKERQSMPTGVGVILVLLVMYLGFPAVLAYPIEKAGKHIPDYIMKPITFFFTPLFFIYDHSTTYKDWIEWQREKLGLK